MTMADRRGDTASRCSSLILTYTFACLLSSLSLLSRIQYSVNRAITAFEDTPFKQKAMPDCPCVGVAWCSVGHAESAGEVRHSEYHPPKGSKGVVRVGRYGLKR